MDHFCDDLWCCRLLQKRKVSVSREREQMLFERIIANQIDSFLHWVVPITFSTSITMLYTRITQDITSTIVICATTAMVIVALYGREIKEQ
jgi:hypothetical protein